MQPLISCYVTLSVATERQPVARLAGALHYKPEGREFYSLWGHWDRLCGLVVRVSGYRYRGLGFVSRRYQIFWVVVGLERGPLRSYLNKKVAAPVQKTEINGRGDPLRWPRGTPLSAKVGTNFADRRRPLCRYSSLADKGHGGVSYFVTCVIIPSIRGREIRCTNFNLYFPCNFLLSRSTNAQHTC